MNTAAEGLRWIYIRFMSTERSEAAGLLVVGVQREHTQAAAVIGFQSGVRHPNRQ